MQQVNKSLLTQEQSALYDEWQRFFASSGWKMYQARFAPRLQQVQRNFLVATGEQALGVLQGAAEQLIDLVIRAEDLVGADFVSLTGELDAPADTEPATGPQSWEE